MARTQVDLTEEVKGVLPVANGGVIWPVRLRDTGGETYTIVSGSVTQIAGTTVDSVSPSVGDRMLIQGAPAATGTGSFGSTQPANGIYTITGNTTNLSLSRADLSGSVNPAGLSVFVGQGGSAGFIYSVDNPTNPATAFTYGTTAMHWNATGSIGIANTFSSQNFTNKTVSLLAGTATQAPLQFASGTSLTTAAAGAAEYDGTAFYLTPVASTRHVNDAEQFITLTSTYTLASQTAAQKLFNAPTNGQVTLAANTTYFFECCFTLSSLSSSSHSVGFALGGTATLTRQAWWADACAPTTSQATANTTQRTFNTAANTSLITTGTTNTTFSAMIKGKIVVGTGGTLIPQVSQVATTAAAVVGVDSYFRIWTVGSNTVQSVGNWS